MNTSTSIKQRTLKLTLVAFACGAALISGTGSAAIVTATATGTVIVPITISNTIPLTFGRFAAGGGGAVTIDTGGNRTATTNIILSSVGANALTAAKFDVAGDPDASYGITYSANNTLTSGGNSMALALISDLAGANATTGTVTDGLLTGGAQSIYVGGVLSVASGQPPGNYTGTVGVTVQYNQACEGNWNSPK